MHLRFFLSTISVCLIVVATAAPSRADLQFTGSSGNLSAEAVFHLSGTTLTVTLSNTSSTTVTDNTNTLGGLVFPYDNPAHGRLGGIKHREFHGFK